MMVGPSGSGKSSAWRVLLKALERYEGVEVGSADLLFMQLFRYRGLVHNLALF